MADWGVVKDSVLQQLRFLDADELAELCTASNITIPPNKEGNRNAIHTIVLRHINSEDVEDSNDQGLGLFTLMDDELKRLLAARGDDKTSVTTGVVTASGSANAGNR